jgi:hypothetical protein
MTHGRHGPCSLLAAVHDRGVELRGPLAGQRRAAAGIEELVVLEGTHGGSDGIETRAALLEDGVSEVEGGCEAIAVATFPFIRQSLSRHRAGATVDGDRMHERSSEIRLRGPISPGNPL